MLKLQQKEYHIYTHIIDSYMLILTMFQVVLWDRRSLLYVSWYFEQSLHVEPPVRTHGKNTSEAMFVIEAYRTLRDRGPYPADQFLRGLKGSFAFFVYDTQTSSVFSALSSDGGESLLLGNLRRRVCCDV